MAAPHDKRRQLDDEMSRFEAEISGPPVMDSLPSQSSGVDMRPIIGVNTYDQIKQQLKEASDDIPDEPSQAPRSFQQQGPPHMPQNLVRHPMPMPGRGGGLRPSFGPGGPIGPGPVGPRPQGFPQGLRPFSPGHNRPGPPGPGPFGQHMGPQSIPGNGPCGPFPPPPPGFMGPRGGNFSPVNINPPPPPPPGFIPPQVNRMSNMGGPMLHNAGNMGPAGRLRPPVSYLRPPPPPPPSTFMPSPHRLAADRNGQRIGIINMATLCKPAAIISSAPKLYGAQSKENQKEDLPEKSAPSVGQMEPHKSTPEPKRRKPGANEKKNVVQSSILDLTHAQEMAERVKQSIVTIKQATHPPHPAHPQQPSEEKKREKKHKKNLRYAGGQIWEDCSLAEWEPDDFRMFAGDLGNDVTDDLLHRHFCHYPSFVKAKVVRDKRTNKSKGYGFISFKDSQDYIRAMKEMNGKYLGSRPIKLRKSMWRDRNLDIVQRKLKEKQLQGLK